MFTRDENGKMVEIEEKQEEKEEKIISPDLLYKISPAHYRSGMIEPIEYIRDNLTKEEFIGFCIGNAYKYLGRWRLKDGIADLHKGIKYLGWAIEREEE